MDVGSHRLGRIVTGWHPVPRSAARSACWPCPTPQLRLDAINAKLVAMGRTAITDITITVLLAQSYTSSARGLKDERNQLFASLIQIINKPALARKLLKLTGGDGIKLVAELLKLSKSSSVRTIEPVLNRLLSTFDSFLCSSGVGPSSMLTSARRDTHCTAR